jgi:hypothetical protein
VKPNPYHNYNIITIMFFAIITFVLTHIFASGFQGYIGSVTLWAVITSLSILPVEFLHVPHLWYFAEFIRDILGARVMISSLVQVLGFALTQVTFGRVRTLVHFLAQFDQLLILALTSTLLTLQASSILWVLVQGHFILTIPLILVFLPAYIILLLALILDVAQFFLGRRTSFLFVGARVVRSGAVRFIRALPLFMYNGVMDVLASLLWAAVLLVKLPLELHALVFFEPFHGSSLNQWDGKYLKLRLGLAIWVFFGFFLPSIPILLFIGLVFLSSLSLSLFFCFVYLGEIPILVVARVYLEYACCLGFGAALLARERWQKVARMVIGDALLARSWLEGKDAYLTVRPPGLPRNGKRYTVRSAISSVTEQELPLLLDDLWSQTRKVYKVTFAALLLYGIVAFITARFLEGVTYIARIPVRICRALFYASLVFLIPDTVLDLSVVACTTGFKVLMSTHGDWVREVRGLFRMLGLTAMFGVTYLRKQDIEALAGGSKYSEEPRVSQLFVKTWVSLTRKAVLRFVEKLDSFRLPEFIQSQYRPPSLDSIRSTYQMMADIGFPVDQSFIDSIDRPESSAYLSEWGSWKNWLLGSSNFALGFRGKTTIPNFLGSFFPEVVAGVHTSLYTSPQAEIKSTARYWNGNHLIKFPGDWEKMVDDLYEAVKPQFQKSQLASPEEIFKKWKKNFNMGFGFGTRGQQGRLKQLTRQAVIDTFGGNKNFVGAWKNVFKLAGQMTMPAPVFTKWEVLKAKKALAGAVRTVVGSPFAHHVMTTVFNYKPNHNYHVWEVPAKVGMPINGQNFDRIWRICAGYQNVAAGDATAFDSSQIKEMLLAAGEVRKKGFELHPDYSKICELIDLSYQQLLTQGMGFKNLGDIAFKAQGATTGHSSTTPDNCLMLAANYLAAWTQITGLRAREFFNFNHLINFGDDHLLCYDPVFGWSPEKAWEVMGSYGTIMRDEAPGQNTLPPVDGSGLLPGMSTWREGKLSFLAKKPLPITPDIRAELNAAGVVVPLLYATVHDRERLLVKVKACNLSGKSPQARFSQLCAYMYLSVHHKDVYNAVCLSLQELLVQEGKTLKPGGKLARGLEKPPSYNQVVRTWYSKDPFPYSVEGDEAGEGDEHHELVVVSNPDPFGVFVRWLSDFPTLLSPRYTNMRWADWIQHRLASQLSWPLDFISQANGVLNDPATAKLYLSRTPYSFLRAPSISIKGEKFGVLIVRHWIYTIISRFWTKRRFVSPLDAVRLLDTFWINLTYVLFGNVQQILVELDLHIFDLILIFYLSKLNIDLGIPSFALEIPSPSILFGQLFSYFLRYITPSGSVDFQSLDAKVRRLQYSASESFMLQAGTGTGKSTRMVSRMQGQMKVPFVVILPRHLLVSTIVPYMKALYPGSRICGQTEGMTAEENFDICYTTVQSFFLSPRLRTGEKVVVIDEAHLDEPNYYVIRNWAVLNPMRKVIMMTATPPEGVPYELVRVPGVNQHNIVQVNQAVAGWPGYMMYASGFANDRVSFEKVLIFVPTIKMMEQLARQIRHKTCFLSSKHKTIDPTATVYLSTSVSDAGLTIPDVGFVISPDVDIVVQQDIEKELIPAPAGLQGWEARRRDGTRVFYRKLSDIVLTQRKGRTGRTIDGTFIKVDILGQQVEELFWNPIDFLSAMSPATEAAYPFIPSSMTEVLPPDVVLALPLWDIVSGYSWQTFLRGQARMWRQGTEAAQHWRDTIRDFRWLQTFYLDRELDLDEIPLPKDLLEIPEQMRELQREDGVDATSFIPMTGEELDPQPEQPPLAPVAPLDVVPGAYPGGLLAPALSGGLSDQNPPPIKASFERQNVPGTGLLCGAYALRGIIYSHLGKLVDVGYIRDLCVAESIAQGNPQENFFEWGVLYAVLLVNYKMRLVLYHDAFLHQIDATAYPEVEGILDESPFLFLDNGHYNYLGVPVP